jgi:hypothetical protein
VAFDRAAAWLMVLAIIGDLRRAAGRRCRPGGLARHHRHHCIMFASQRGGDGLPDGERADRARLDVARAARSPPPATCPAHGCWRIGIRWAVAAGLSIVWGRAAVVSVFLWHTPWAWAPDHGPQPGRHLCRHRPRRDRARDVPVRRSRLSRRQRIWACTTAVLTSRL